MDDDRWIKEPDKKDKPNHSKFIIIVILIGVALAALIALLHGDPKVKTLTLDKTNVSLGIDETDRLTATVKPDDAKPILIWESSDENIVKVNDGVVMACSAGNAVIKVYVEDRKDLFASCEYTVLDPDVDMLTLDILEEPIVLRPGGHQQLTVSFTPENQNEMILWSSTNESVARVSPRGKVEALKVGFAKIIATSERTGVADTAVVSVEGSGVIDNRIVAQTDNPQNTPAPAQNPASSQKPATTQNPAPASASKPAQTPTSKSIPVKASNPTPASTAKTTTVSTKKPAQTTASKTTVSTTSKSYTTQTTKPATSAVSKTAASTVYKPAASTASKPATSTVSKTTTVNTSKPAQTTTTKSSGTKDLGYATFRGTWPDDVKGRMEFKSTHVIDSRDPKNRYASPGDYIIGEWSEGHLVQGVWYGSDNKPKGSILIGK